MIRRRAPKELIDALKGSAFWENIVDDRQLQPEIRDNKITVYYMAAAMLHEIQYVKGQLRAGVARAYVPLCRDSSRVGLCLSEKGEIGFQTKLAALPLGDASNEVRKYYKECIKQVQGKSSEGALVQKICELRGNTIVDQEISFSDRSGDANELSTDKIDICCFEPYLRKLLYVEVKRIGDARLYGSGREDAEVISQLRRYGERVRKHKNGILEACRKVLGIKRQLGLGDRFLGLPKDENLDLVDKPALLVGHCSTDEVEAILNDGLPGFPRLKQLKEVASALFLCEGDRRAGGVRSHAFKITFDPAEEMNRVVWEPLPS